MNCSISRIVALAITIFILVNVLVSTPSYDTLGVRLHGPLVARLTYHFFHVSFIHAAVNVWCLLSIIFVYDLSWIKMLVAYIIAAIAPDFVLFSTPTVGLSAVCFALLGSIAFQVKRKLYYNGCMALYIGVSFIFPLVNGWLHLYSYVAGLFVGFLTMPIQCRKR